MTPQDYDSVLASKAVTSFDTPRTSAAHSASPRYAVIVATRNRSTKIVALMESVLASEVHDFEMVIVDQSTDDLTRRALTPYLHDVRIRYLHSHLTGTSRARNLGISTTTAPIIVITDDDCVVPKCWLSALGSPFQRYPEVGVVFCSVEPVPVDAPGLTPHIVFAGNFLVRDIRNLWRRSANGFALGAGMAVRRTMFNDVCGFDELLGPGAKFGAAEDNDLSWRGLMRGWLIFLCADVAVVHDGFRTLKEVRSLVERDMYGVGGALSKYLRVGRWEFAALLASMILRLGVMEPARDLVAGRRPRGFRRPYMLIRGVADGLRTPINSTHLTFALNSSSVSQN
jgi:GT2 family glycosyltransferase